MSDVAVYWDHQARCYVGRDLQTGVLSAGTTRERAVLATASAAAMVRRFGVARSVQR